MWQAAKRCELSLWEIIEEVKKELIHVPYTSEDLKKEIRERFMMSKIFRNFR